MSQHPAVGVGMVLDPGVGELACNGWPEGESASGLGPGLGSEWARAFHASHER